MQTVHPTSSYRKIVSSTVVFGGAQLVGMIVNLIRGKLVALILHSAGIGIMSLLTNAANTIQQFALLGINIAAVRNISQAKEDGQEEVLAATVRIVRTLVFFAALLGLLFTILSSPLMSQVSFGSYDYVAMFLLLSVSVFLNVLGTGEMAVMQGLRRYKRLALCSIVPPLCGLLISVPIYYFFGTKGIVPAMIVSGIIYYVAIRFNSYRDQQPTLSRQRLSLRTIWRQGNEIIKFGMVMTFGTVTGTITTYLLTAFISNSGSVSDVGFYQSANVITVQYVSLIFSAMATDYFPRLSALYKSDARDANVFVNQQTEIVILTIAPLGMLIILTAPLLIKVLLTSEFLVICRIVYFMGLASIFKALCFPMDYIAYAKGDRPYIVWVETVWGNAKTFTVMALCYYFFGLDGLGYGALTVAVIDAIVSTALTRWRYDFRLSGESLRLLGVMLLLAGSCFAAAFVSSAVLSYSVMTGTTAIGTIYSLIQLDRRMNLRLLFRQRLLKRG